jgi:hypothetical protein
MRTRKAALAGVGSSGSLVAAVVCVFLLVSAAIVFKGWPDGPGERVDTQAIGGSVPVTGAGAAAAGATAGASGGLDAASGVVGAQGVLGASESSTGVSPVSARGGIAGTAPDRARSPAQTGRRAGGDGAPTVSGPSAAETVAGIVKRAARDFGPVTVDLPGTGGGGDDPAGGGPVGGDPAGGDAPKVDTGAIDDAADDAGDQAGNVVDDVSDAVGGNDEKD